MNIAMAQRLKTFKMMEMIMVKIAMMTTTATKKRKEEKDEEEEDLRTKSGDGG